jgi:hypothetical protein
MCMLHHAIPSQPSPTHTAFSLHLTYRMPLVRPSGMLQDTLFTSSLRRIQHVYEDSNRQASAVLATWIIRSGKSTTRMVNPSFTTCKQRQARVQSGVVTVFSCSDDDHLMYRRNVFYESRSSTSPAVEGFLLGCALPSLCSLDEACAGYFAYPFQIKSATASTPSVFLCHLHSR